MIDDYIILVIVLLILLVNIFMLIKINKYKYIDYKKEIDDIKFNQQTQILNIQKFLADEFGNLREKVVITVSRYNEETMKELLTIQNKINNNLHLFKESLHKDIYYNFEKISKNMSENLDKINDKVNMQLNEGFEKTTKTFNNLLERLSKIDEAQKKIESLSTNIISLQDVLTDKKTRGTFGEIQLKQILFSIFGDNNNKVYELQKKLSNNKIADAILYTPQPLGNIVIDSKFPLENYKNMINKDLSNYENSEAKKLFKQDVKNHINSIKEKYIIVNETCDSAIMFLPAEAIFAEINAYHNDIIEYSQKSHVWIASPTTLMFLLTTVQVILRNLERDKYSTIIHEELNKLGVEFKRYKDRWDKLSKNIDQVSKNVKELHTTSGKIERHFDSISQVNLNNDNIKVDILSKEEDDESSS